MNDNNANASEHSHAATALVRPLLLTARAAEMLSVGRMSVYELIAAGDLETVHIGRCMRIPADSLHGLIARRRHRAVTKR